MQKDPKMIERHEIVDVAFKIIGKETRVEAFLYEVMILIELIVYR